MQQILILISAFVASILYAFTRGKKSVEIKQNEEVVKDVQKFNQIKREVSALNESDRDKLVRKFTKDSRK